MEQVADRLREPLLEAVHGVRGIPTRRQGDDANVKARADGELHAADRCRLAGGIRVEAEIEVAREPAELLELRFGERRAHRSHGRAEPRLVQGQDVGVALDDDGPVLLRDRGAGAVEAVDDRALAKELPLRRVDVLGRDRVVLPHAPRAEAEHPSASVGQREDEAPGVVVVAAPIDETCRHELVLREALRPCLLGQDGAAGRETESVLAAHLLLEPPPGQVLAGRSAGAGVPEVALVEDRGLLQQGEKAGTSLALRLGLRRRFLVGERDSVALGQPFDRAHEVEPLGLLDERDQVALHAAPEAVEELVGRVHREAWRPLLVKGAASCPARADLPELGAGAHDLDHVRRRLDLVDRALGDYRHASAKRSVIPAT